MTHLISPLQEVAPDALVEAMTERIRALRTRAGRTPVDHSRPVTYRLTLATESISPLTWLAGQSVGRRIYWGDRNGSWQMAGVGAAETITMNAPIIVTPLFKRLDYVLSEAPEGMRYYGGMRFDYRARPSDNRSPWRCLPDCLFVLPRFELLRYGEDTLFSCNLLDTDLDDSRINQILADINRLLFTVPDRVRMSGDAGNRVDSPDRYGWDTLLSSARRHLQDGSIEKVVLARESVMTTAKPVPAWSVLRELHDKGDCYTFAFEFDPGTVFFGATPERLYSRKGVLVETEAQAGTRPRGSTSAEDSRLAEELMGSEKDRREHQYVIQGISAAMDRAGISHKIDGAVTVRTTPQVQHLYARIIGRLSKADDGGFPCDATILSALHPTPAVAGLPVNEAMDLIAELEPFDRGWYAGPVGWIAADRSEFAVAIRSALARPGDIRLYAGAGIVDGSRSDDEWEELENKIAALILPLIES